MILIIFIINIFFFNFNGNILSVSEKIFKSFGIYESELAKGSSSHVTEKVYYEYSVFGIKLKIEYNSYDYDDKYRYMLSTREDVLSGVTSDDNFLLCITNRLGDLLAELLNGDLMYENENDELLKWSSLV